MEVLLQVKLDFGIQLKRLQKYSNSKILIKLEGSKMKMMEMENERLKEMRRKILTQ